MPLVFLPDREALFAFGKERDASGVLGSAPGTLAQAELVLPEGRRVVEGLELELLDTVEKLAALPAAMTEELSGSVATWVLASKLAIELVAHERVVPAIRRRSGRIEVRWAAALASADETAKLKALANAMPPAAHAVPVPNGNDRDVWAGETMLRAFIDAVVDCLVRSSKGGPSRSQSRANMKSNAEAHVPWEERWQSALLGQTRSFETKAFSERSLIAELERWSEPALGAQDRLRACFRLELPTADDSPFLLRFLLQSPEDPSLLVSAADVWTAKTSKLQKFGKAFREPQESLLEALARAARLYPPIKNALAMARPEVLELDPTTAWTFLSDAAGALVEAGFGVIVPSELTSAGQRRLRLRMRVGAKSKVAGAVSGSAGLSLDELLTVDWQAVVGDTVLSLRELSALARQKASLVRYRGAWIAVDPGELSKIRSRIAQGPAQVSMREAMQAALAGETAVGELVATVVAKGSFAQTLERLQSGASAIATPPQALKATLRPYQERGLAWLRTMSAAGFGACLADDMGLGKTMQVLAFLLLRMEEIQLDLRPALLVAPTSVLGNWEREIARFAPSLIVVPHYALERARRVEDFSQSPQALVLTSYGILRRDVALLSRVDWSVVVLDEAQNIKNSASATAQAARELPASQRIALTGTPVENRLAELWSIFEFANPGLLGTLDTFRRKFAVPIERYANDDAAKQLRRIVSPFILRRLKSDKAIISDLPAKNEMKVICTLSREQASLYRAVVDEEMRRIESAQGIERRGRVLALLTFLKQICNHPAQYLNEPGPLARRSGKLTRLTEMLEEALAAGDKVLVFTQFREMGERLVAHVQASFGSEVAFLHGATSKRARDALVQRFQEDARGPRVFVLSLKAGGTGLNLTRASHVFHYDRWWNPAVEDQATDRAYRIGQTRAVQVHKLLCAGTVEEKVDRLLEAKRSLADKIVGAGENFITELSNDDLRELFALSKDAVIAAEDSGELDDDESSGRVNSKQSKSRRRRAEARE